MIHRTFANVHIEDEILGDVEGGSTIHQPTGEETPVFEACQRYREEDTPPVVLAGEKFGAGSGRSWAAKGADLLGMQAIITESCERTTRTMTSSARSSGRQWY